jgi:serine/threonine protein kinase
MTISWEDHIELKILKKQLYGKYELQDFLGRGGFGKVFKIKDRNLNRECALKILNIYEPAEDNDEKREESKIRFIKEAKALAKCKHQNIVSIYSIGGEGAFPYLVMEYIEGRSLGDILEEEEILDFDEIVKVSSIILSALDYIHANGLIHRDLKPDNIIIENGTGRIVIIDFSIARDIVSGTKITDMKFIHGTPFYMAPEQFKNIVSPGIDIYSYGIILYRMLTGKVPFKGKLLDIVQGHLTAPIPDIRKKNSEAPPGIQGVIEKALAKEQKDRYQRAEDFLIELKQLRNTKSLKKKRIGAGANQENHILTAVRKKLEDKYDFAGGRLKEGLYPTSYSYLVHHKIFEEDHVLKIRKLNVNGLKNEYEKRKEKFKQEARFFNKFKNHPNIVDIIDAGFIPFEEKNEKYEIPYRIVKHIKGVSLLQFILRKAPLELKHIFNISMDLLSALIDIHKNDYIFWSINPEDINIDKKNNNIAIFKNAGFFKDRDIYNETEREVSNISIDKNLLDNLISFSSEPWGGIKERGIAADISLFGILLYEMVTGETRYESSFLGNLGRKSEEPFLGIKERKPDLPGGIVNIIEKALAKNPEKRYKRVPEILRELKKIKKNCAQKLKGKDQFKIKTEKVFFE